MRSLHKRWLWLAILCLFGIVGGYAFLDGFWDQQSAVRWALGALAGLSYLLWRVWGALPHNHRQGESEVLASFGKGTLFTLLRGYLISLMVGFHFVPQPPGWLALIPALLYTIAALTDIFDGYFARRENRVTAMGQMLDLDLDGLGVLVACVLGVQYGQLPIWFLPVGVARYLFLLGIAVLKRRGKPVYDLPPSLMRRVTATFQMGFMSVVLYPVFSPPATTIVATVFMVPMLAGFVRDWLVVSGSIKPEAASYRRVRAAVKSLVEQALPPLMRLLATGALIWQIVLGGTPEFSAGGLGQTTFTATLLGAAQIALCAMILTGTLGRLAAVILLTLTAGAVGQSGLNAPLLILCISIPLIAIYGTGPISIWKPEDSIFRPRTSEQDE